MSFCFTYDICFTLNYQFMKVRYILNSLSAWSLTCSFKLKTNLIMCLIIYEFMSKRRYSYLLTQSTYSLWKQYKSALCMAYINQYLTIVRNITHTISNFVFYLHDFLTLKCIIGQNSLLLVWNSFHMEHSSMSSHDLWFRHNLWRVRWAAQSAHNGSGTSQV